MKHLIIGTAGHVDHGKTALIRALTGVETDRLPEEKARGISIDIGFAHFTLPSGRRAGVIDVPGHEKFIRNMLAGITGIDLVLLVVAADEGVMPQTREHLDILRLLDIKQGAIVLTKRDLVDDDLLELVQEDVAQAVQGTFLAGAPMVAVSSVTGAGLPELRALLDTMLEGAAAKDATGFARLPIDRSFTRAGFGTVVTGTLVGGKLRVGDKLDLLPAGLEARVRGLQVHGDAVEEARAGQRVAVNVAGVERAEVRRGDVLATPGALRATDRFAGRLQVLPTWEKGLPHGTRVHLHIGAAEAIGRVSLLEGEHIEPGQSALVQIKLETPVVVGRGDALVVRSYSPVHTLGGGRVIEPHAHYKRNSEAARSELTAKEGGGTAGVLAAALAASGAMPLRIPELSQASGVPPEVVADELPTLLESGDVLSLEAGLYLHRRGLGSFADLATAELTRYQQQYPLRTGMPKEELRKRVLPKTDLRAFDAVLREAIAHGELAQTGNTIHRPDWQPPFSPAQTALLTELKTAVSAGGFAPPTLAELKSQAKGPAGKDFDELVLHLVDQGEWVRLQPELVLAADVARDAKERVRAHLKAHGKITVAEIRDLLGTSRKFALPLAEWFDQEKLTRRLGDERVLGFGQ